MSRVAQSGKQKRELRVGRFLIVEQEIVLGDCAIKCDDFRSELVEANALGAFAKDQRFAMFSEYLLISGYFFVSEIGEHVIIKNNAVLVKLDK